MKKAKKFTVEVNPPPEESAFAARQVQVNSVRRDCYEVLTEVITVLWRHNERLPLTESLLLWLDRECDALALDGIKPVIPSELTDRWARHALHAAAAEAYEQSLRLTREAERKREDNGTHAAALAVYWALMALLAVGFDQYQIDAAQPLARFARYHEGDAAAFSAEPQPIHMETPGATNTKSAKKPAKKGAKR